MPRPTSQRFTSPRPIPTRERKKRSPALLPELLRLGEQTAALRGEVVEREAETAVEGGVVLSAEPSGLPLDDLRRLQLERIQVLLGELVPRASTRTDIAVLLVPSVGSSIRKGSPRRRPSP